jgi:hypothetical protein
MRRASRQSDNQTLWIRHEGLIIGEEVRREDRWLSAGATPARNLVRLTPLRLLAGERVFHPAVDLHCNRLISTVVGGPKMPLVVFNSTESL